MGDIKSDYIEEIISKRKIKIVLICAVVILMLIFISIRQGVEEKENFLIYVLPVILLLTLIILLAFCYYFGVYKKKKFIFRRDKIIQNGIHVVGNIISKEMIFHSNDSKGRKNYYYYVKVKFNNNNEEIIIDSPWLSFDPEYISSDLVDVYIYNEEYYITNYRLDTETMKKDIEKEKKNIKKSIILVLLMVPLFGILVYLTNEKYISSNTFGFIFMGSFLAIAIYSIIDRFKGDS